MSKLIDLIGERFGRLIVIKRVENDKWGNSRWLCRCNCKDKNETIVRGGSLKSGNTKSCGCLSIEKTTQRTTRHGHTKNGEKTGFYRSWDDMIQRCTNPNDKSYHNYGGRGITVCKEWLKFPNFEKDMIKGWKPGLTIERTDKDGNYCPDNCEWITLAEQQRNRRNNRLITAFGKTQIMIKWSEETGIPYSVIRWRINHGWLSERALTESVRQCKKRKNK